MSGITGVSAGSVAVVNLPVGQRYHRMQLNCTGVNYTGGVAVVPTIVTAGGFTNTTGTVRLNVTNGVVTSVTYVAGNSAGATTSTVLSVPDSTGATPIILTCTAAGSGALGNATFSIGAGTAGPMNPSTLITSLRLLVNGIVVRDINPSQVLAIMTASGYFPQYGTLPIWFTEPPRNFLRDNELNSWDLAGQNTFQIQFGVSSTVTTPGVSGWIEFDFQRNARSIKSAKQLNTANAQLPSGAAAYKIGDMVPFLQPVAQHSFSIPITSGRFDVTTLPWNNPITRLWLSGSVQGQLYQVEVLADGVMVFQATAQQLYEDAAEYGFQIGNDFYAPVAGGGYGAATLTSPLVNPSQQNPSSPPNGALVSSPYLWGSLFFPFDAAVIFDNDNRPWKALRVAKSLILRVYSNQSQNLTVIQESLPGAFNG